MEVQADPRYDSFDPAWGRFWAAVSHVITGGDPNRWSETCADLAQEPRLAHVTGLDGLLYMLPVVGRAEEARAMAAETLRLLAPTATQHGSRWR